ncbi:MAG TPA: class I SAM-dependent methyltransferase [Actinomycetota bacterium]|nr:class I SAM-dependent methyltransferase [Actinomycetota bacterium]
MLTVDFDRLAIKPGDLLLDLGCGAGRHTFEALKRGANVVPADLDRSNLPTVAAMGAAMSEADEARADALSTPVQSDALALPFADNSFDHVIVSEVLEHIPADEAAMAEIARVLKPGRTAVVTVPRFWPERICWALSKTYTSSAGGHVRIYRSPELIDRLGRAGLTFIATHHAHAFHSPYWWVKCAVGVDRDSALPARMYKRFLEWQIVNRPPLADGLERALDPFMGKSLVVYTRKAANEAEARRVA